MLSLYFLLSVWLPLGTTAIFAYAALKNIKGVLIITAAVGVVFYFFSDAPAPEPPPLVRTAPSPYAAYLPPPAPPHPLRPPVQATAVRPPCVAPTPAHQGKWYYECTADGRVRASSPIPGTASGDEFIRDWAQRHPNE